MKNEAAAYRAATRAQLQERIDRGPPLLLDGAVGGELERRGVPAGLPLWSSHALLTHPEVVAAVHADYAAAGAEILTANSFRTQRRTLARAGPPAQGGERDAELTALAVSLARRAAHSAGRRIFVAGSAAPLEDCFSPARVPDDASLCAEHTRHAQNLADAGVDLILIETMNCVREAVAAARATGLAFHVSFVSWRSAELLSGEPLAAGLAAVAPFAPLSVGINCLPPSAVPACLPVLADHGRPFGVYANLGAPIADTAAKHSEECTPAQFAAHARGWLQAGARLIGGCCGTRPAHIRALADLLSAR